MQAGLVTVKDGKVTARSKSGQPTPWETYTARMLKNRAISFAGKAQCPEVALGFGIEGDMDYIDEPVDVTPPEHHGDVVDADVVDDPEAVAAALDQIELAFEPTPDPADDDNE